jgi:YD repeat-containing protein
VSLALALVFGLTLPGLAQQISYEYDALGRLIRVIAPEGVAEYEYDAVGNILRIITRRAADAPGPVAILSVSPTKGAPGTTVRLYGKGFATTPGDNQVAFNRVPATVTAATSSSLTTTVPSGATTGPITLTTLTTLLGTATSPEPFTVLQAFAVEPAQADVALGGLVDFQATVGGTPTSAVTWRVNGIAGGNATLGTITTTGTYTAPSTPPPVQPVSVEAVLTADPTQVATARVRIVGQVSGMEAAAPVSVGVVPPSSPAASGPVSVAVTPQSAPAASGPVSVSRGPVVTAVSPNTGAQGSSNLPVSLSGANCQGASAIRFLRNGATDSSLTASTVSASGDGTSVNFILAISASAPTGPRVVQVVTPQGTSTNFDLGMNVFTVPVP